MLFIMILQGLTLLVAILILIVGRKKKGVIKSVLDEYEVYYDKDNNRMLVVFPIGFDHVLDNFRGLKIIDAGTMGNRFNYVLYEN